MCVRSREQRLIESLQSERGGAPCTCGHEADEHDLITGWCKRIVRWHSNEVTSETCLCEEYRPERDAETSAAPTLS